MSTYEQITDLESRFLINTYARYPLAITHGKGVYVYDIDGRKYLDFVGGLGVNALGHAHPRIVKAIRQQAARVIHTSNLYYNEFQGRLAERLVRLSGLDRAFFSNSGTEAIEGALKVARAAGNKEGKCKVVALRGSFHGRTFGAMSLTGQEKYRKGFEPLFEPVAFIAINNIEELNAAVDDGTCAIFLETIQGEGGIRECSTDFLRAARVAADRHGAALVLDEIQCGMGRTGTMFAYQQHGVVPDIVALAKPIAGGVPLGAVLAREKFAGAITPGKHGTTFGGGPFATRVALEYLDVLEEEKLLEQVVTVGHYMHNEFLGLKERFPELVVEARGRGMIQALELKIPARPIVDSALEQGVLFNVTQDTVLRFLPPYLLEEKHVDKGVKVLRKLLSKQGAPSMAQIGGEGMLARR